MASALERCVSREAGAMMRSPFFTWDVDRIRSLFSDAGFRTVQVTIEVGGLRYPSVWLQRRSRETSPLLPFATYVLLNPLRPLLSVKLPSSFAVNLIQ